MDMHMSKYIYIYAYIYIHVCILDLWSTKQITATSATSNSATSAVHRMDEAAAEMRGKKEAAEKEVEDHTAGKCGDSFQNEHYFCRVLLQKRPRNSGNLVVFQIRRTQLMEILALGLGYGVT